MRSVKRIVEMRVTKGMVVSNELCLTEEIVMAVMPVTTAAEMEVDVRIHHELHEIAMLHEPRTIAGAHGVKFAKVKMAIVAAMIAEAHHAERSHEGRLGRGAERHVVLKAKVEAVEVGTGVNRLTGVVAVGTATSKEAPGVHLREQIAGLEGETGFASWRSIELMQKQVYEE